MRFVGLVLAALVVFGLAGCGDGTGGGVTAKGQVVKDGAPVKLEDGEVVSIKITNGKETFNTNAFPDGNFSIQKPGGGGIPAGKYKVSYVHQRSADPYKKTAAFSNKKDLGEMDISSSNPTLKVDIGGK
jgi:hypothetical protein